MRNEGYGRHFVNCMDAFFDGGTDGSSFLGRGFIGENVFGGIGPRIIGAIFGDVGWPLRASLRMTWLLFAFKAEFWALDRSTGRPK